MADNSSNSHPSRQDKSANLGSQIDSQNQQDNPQQPDQERKRPGKKPLIILGVVVIVMVIVALIWWLMTRNQETTDDAFTDGNAVTIAPKVAGYVTDLQVNDNQRVKKGQLLVVIDPRDAMAQRDQAQAQLALAQAQLHQAQAQYDLAKVQYPAQRAQALAQVLKAKADMANASADYRRQRGVDPRATSQQNIDSANAQMASAQSELKNAEARLAVAEQVGLQLRTRQTNVEARARQVEQAKAQLEAANLNLSYTEVRAPFDGYVTRRNVQLGTLVQAGSALFSLVSSEVWVTANFKENQLERMKPGNKVTISVDAWPDLKLEGHIDSIQQGSGSRFSAFPAENATGNFVKIVQRVPVKIIIDKGLDPQHHLPLGLSVEPKVMLE